MRIASVRFTIRLMKNERRKGKVKIGILGTGGIVGGVVPTLKKLEQIECYAIASRTLEKAKQVAEKYGFTKAYGSYEELVADKEVEFVYIATPHSRHFEDMKLCLEYGKHVLCEKAFTLNAEQAKEIQRLSKEKGLFVAEAIWPRYMPSRYLIDAVVESGMIGTVTRVTANLCAPISHVPRLIRPELAGGTLLDLGVYGLNFVIMHCGTEFDRVESSVELTETGVDGTEKMTLFYNDGKVAELEHSMFYQNDTRGIFYGEKGHIVVENIINPQSISVYDLEDKLIKTVQIPPQISGYEYEFVEVVECIQQGKLESISMPFVETIYMMELMDSFRKEWGVVYPQEKEN